ncbi:MAG: hypothetical protein COT18_04685 [Elusimicrobia bacterium CG08_land_8_20_14_0_20_59_10]|nr:MAG: hypothetical protein COT18_04685 [Elusimicrobia bacterium CG08_land_8_20_14_0_20_59_10]
MNTGRSLLFFVIPAAALLAACATAGKRNAPENIIPADSAAFRYEGRFDITSASAPVIIWQGSRIYADFKGEKLDLLFGHAEGRNFFNISVDGEKSVIGLKPGETARAGWPRPLKPGRHSLELFKRSEASAGTAVFLGIELAPGKKALKPRPPAYKLTMLFFGDSITAGACSEDGAADQWEDRSTHNNALSYAALTAAAFRADYHNIAISGMGISAGYTKLRAGQAWDRLYPRADSPRADLKTWTPQLIFINYGENDSSFTRGKGLPFPEDFAAGYQELVRNIRAAWPEARIVLLRGGMYGGSQSPELGEVWKNAASDLEAADPGINRYVFEHWSENHPRAADHRALAGELTAWLKQQGFMETYR